MSSAVYETIKSSKNLPSPTGVALEILRLAQDEKATFEDMAQAIEADPAVSSRLIKMVNSPFAGLPRQISSVERAVGLLGTRTITGLALSFSVVGENRRGQCPGFDYETFWSESLARGVSARHIAQLVGRFAPDEAFTCGLLCQVGRLAIATAFPEAYPGAIKDVVEGDLIALAEVEREVFGIDHNDLAAEMMSDWYIAEVFHSAVRIQLEPGTDTTEVSPRSRLFARVLHLSGHLAEILLHDSVSDRTLSDLFEEAGALDIDLGDHHEAIDAIGSEWRDLGGIFKVRTRDVPPARELYAQAASLRGVRTGAPLVPLRETETDDANAHAQRIRILIVDDDSDALEMLERLLIGAGYEVVKAVDGDEAMQILLTDGPSVVIADWMMPKMDGLELCRAIRTHPGVAFVYVIIASACDADENRVVEAFDAGADSFLSKPFRRKELLARLRAAERIARLQLDLEARRREVHRYNAEMEIANAKLGRANQDLARMATTDELTGLINRREALNQLSQHWARAERNGTPLSIITLDIDRFKSCNDTYGHAAGDAVLKEAAEAFCRTVRHGETVCRVGGEEFLVLCPHTTEEAAAVCAERIRVAVEGLVIRHGELTLRTRVSLGVASRTADLEGADALLRVADNALYEAKRAGRNAVRVARPPNAAQNEASKGGAPGKLLELKEPPVEETARILVADDDADAARCFQELLEQAGYHVHVVETGSDATKAVNETLPDVAIVGTSIVDTSGTAWARMIKANPATQHIPIILASGPCDGPDVVRDLGEGVDEHLSKPVNAQELTLRVKTMVRLGRELKRSNEVRGEQSRALNLIQELCSGVGTADSLKEVLAETVQAAARMLGCRQASILLPDTEGGYLVVAQCLEDEDSDVWNIRVRVGEATSGLVFSTGKHVVVNTEAEAKEHQCAGGRDAPLLSGIPSASVALCDRERVVGVLNLTGRQPGRSFSDVELDYLDLICNVAASAIHERLTRCARDEARHSIVVALAKLAESRDEGTGKHLERVTQFSGLIADALRSASGYEDQIDEAFLDNLQQGVPLHDIGKVAVPDRILLKPGRLTADEMAIMKTHATIGAKTIQSVIEQMPGTTFLTTAGEIAHAHHEWFDGTGYPRGLSGRKIPLAARIVAVADLYDAITSERPYKQAMPHATAVSIIIESSGAHFDPIVVEAFRSCEAQFMSLAAELADRSISEQPPILAPEAQLESSLVRIR